MTTLAMTSRNGDCPEWCLGAHREGYEHHSARTRLGGLVAELIWYPDDGQVYLSLLEARAGGRYLLVPMEVVPHIATAALRLVAGRRPV